MTTTTTLPERYQAILGMIAGYSMSGRRAMPADAIRECLEDLGYRLRARFRDELRPLRSGEYHPELPVGLRYEPLLEKVREDADGNLVISYRLTDAGAWFAHHILGHRWVETEDAADD